MWWCGIVFGLLAIVTGIRMIKREEGPDLRHKRYGTVYGQNAVTQGKTILIFGVLTIILCITIIFLQKP
jgi:phosphatidylglycerophosphate synthase